MSDLISALPSDSIVSDLETEDDYCQISMDEPVRLLTVHDDKDKPFIKLNKHALNLLQSIKGPCSCIAVVGGFRTGKSTFLNFMYGKPVFKTSDGVECCTKGIDMFIMKHPKETQHVILLDSEGLYNPEVSAQVGQKLFVLIAILASCIVVNVEHKIDVTTLQELVRVSTLLRFTKDGAKHPKCAFVVQKENLSRGRMDDDEYLQNLLEKCADKSIKKSIDKLFPERWCRFIKSKDTPEGEEKLRSTGKWLLGIADLCPSLTGNESVGSTLVSMLQANVKVLNESDTGELLLSVDIDSTVQPKVESYERKLNDLQANFRRASNELMPLCQLTEAHNDILDELCGTHMPEMQQVIKPCLEYRTKDTFDSTMKSLKEEWKTERQKTLDNALDDLRKYVKGGGRVDRDIKHLKSNATAQLHKNLDESDDITEATSHFEATVQTMIDFQTEGTSLKRALKDELKKVKIPIGTANVIASSAGAGLIIGALLGALPEVAVSLAGAATGKAAVVVCLTILKTKSMKYRIFYYKRKAKKH